MTGRNKDVASRLMNVSHVLLPLSVVFLLVACVPAYPKYIPSWGGAGVAGQSAYHRQIGDRTFVITYQGDHGIRGLQGAQEYVLHRAGELTKNFPAKYFEVLYRDDWEFLYRDGKQRIGLPGAGLVIRILDKTPRPLPSEAADHVYEVAQLLKELAENNPGIAEYHGSATVFEVSDRMIDDSFVRWRSVFNHYQVSGESSRSISEQADSASHREEIKTRTGEIGEVIKAPGRHIEVVLTGREGDDVWPSPFEFLVFCATIAEREGFKAFKLENWRVEEHHTKRMGLGSFGSIVRLKAKAHIAFFQQRDLNSFGPVFEVNAIRSALQPNAFCGEIRAC